MNERPRLMGHLRRPSPAELQDCADQEHIALTTDEAAALVPFVESYLEALDDVEAMPDPSVELKHPTRTPGHVPGLDEDPFGAFSRLCRVEGSGSGALAGRTLAVKDNIAVAGIPKSNGSRTMSHVPLADAVVVERVLDAGATIVGMLNMDDYGCSGYGETSVFGPPRNPLKPTHTPGGSSGGAGSALASGAVDLALGVDQGGSARIPAAMCGCVAVKATYGLVPLFGTEDSPAYMDFICPMARTVEDVAVLLDVVAGGDWRDASSVRIPEKPAPYADAATAGVSGLRVGLVTECLDDPRCQPAVRAGAMDAAQRLADAGASVDNVSLPEWNSAFPVWLGLWLRGVTARIRSDELGFQHLGHVDASAVHAAGVRRRTEATLFPPLAKLTMITTAYVERRYYNTPFAKVQNQRLRLKQAFDEALARYDVLLTPTSPTTAVPLSTQERIGEIESLNKAVSQVAFTAPLNVTGHPALAMPSGTDENGLPTSVQLIGRAFDEATVFKAAFSLERLRDNAATGSGPDAAAARPPVGQPAG